MSIDEASTPAARIVRSKHLDPRLKSKQRVASDRVRSQREAMNAARAFNHLIAQWHPKIALLRGLATYQRRPFDTTELARETENFAHAIAEQQLALAAILATLPPDVAASDRLTDTVRAINSAATAVSDISGLLLRPVATTVGISTVTWTAPGDIPQGPSLAPANTPIANPSRTPASERQGEEEA